MKYIQCHGVILIPEDINLKEKEILKKIEDFIKSINVEISMHYSLNDEFGNWIKNIDQDEIH